MDKRRVEGNNKECQMNDWAADYVVDYIENGQRYRTIWSGFSYEDAMRAFKEAYPERTVIEGEDQP